MEGMDFIQGLMSYGALGIVCAYFMLKDWTLNKKITDTMQSMDKSFALLVQVFGKGGVN